MKFKPTILNWNNPISYKVRYLGGLNVSFKINKEFKVFDVGSYYAYFGIEKSYLFPKENIKVLYKLEESNKTEIEWMKQKFNEGKYKIFKKI